MAVRVAVPAFDYKCVGFIPRLFVHSSHFFRIRRALFAFVAIPAAAYAGQALVPHVALLVVGILTLALSFIDLGSVISALIVTRILEQFVAQCIGVIVLRQRRPDLPRPYRMWLYPLPSLLALIGWTGLYVTSNPIFILLGMTTLVLGIAAFLLWSWRGKMWPFK